MLWIIGALNSNNQQQTSPPSIDSTYSPSSSSNISTYTTPSYSSSSAESFETPSSTRQLDGNASLELNHRAYVESGLRAKREEIEKEKASFSRLTEQLDTLGREIDINRSYVNEMTASSISVFNAKVDKYNDLLRRARAQQARRNSLVDDYNSQINSDGRWPASVVTPSPSSDTGQELVTDSSGTAATGQTADWLAAAPSPTAAETPMPRTYHVINVVNDRLNLRSGPGSTYPIVGTLSPNAGGILLLEGRAQNGSTMWQQIAISGYTGWVNEAYIEMDR